MNSEMNLSDVLHGNWLLQQDDSIATEGIHSKVDSKNEIHREQNEETRDDEEDGHYENEIELLEVGPPIQTYIEEPKGTVNVIKPEPGFVMTKRESTFTSNEKRVLISPPYLQEQPRLTITDDNHQTSSKSHLETQQPPVCYPTTTGASGGSRNENFVGASNRGEKDHISNHAYSVSSTYHQPFLPMVRNRKPSAVTSALTSALQRPIPVHTSTPMFSYLPGYPIGYGIAHPTTLHQQNDLNNNDSTEIRSRESLTVMKNMSSLHNSRIKKETSSLPDAFSTSGCRQAASFIRNHHDRCFELPANVLDGNVDESCDERNETLEELDDAQDGRQSPVEKTETNGRDADRVDRSPRGHCGEEAPEEESGEEDAEDAEQNEREEEDEEIVVDVRDDEEERATGVVASSGEGGALETATSSTGKENTKSELATLLMQPVKRPVYQEYQPFLVTFSASGTQQSVQSSKTMQFYQPPAQQHLARATPPPGFAQPYGMNMRPHEEETRQIMNLDNQQTHSSSPTSSWNQPYGQMTNLNAYQPRGQSLYAPAVPTSIVHQNGPPGVVPTSNPYYQPQHGPPHHHMQPQAPMMPPGIHAQQQPYYNTQSPLTGTPPSMNYGTPQMPAPQTTNGSTPIFNFSKPRTSNESSSGSGGGHRRKKQNDLSLQSSPRYNNNSDEVDASVFPDMSDFPLLDVVQSKAKKDAGRKPCRPHLCEQSRMLISRVCHFHREFIKRLPARHPLANSPFSKPDQWTSAIMGISLATVRKCVDMAVDEEVFTRCTDKNLVNLTPSERTEREELLSKLSTVFEDEKSLGAGTAGLTIAEYSPRRSYSNTLLRQSTDDKSSNSSFAMNGADFGSSETTLLNLDDHSNSSKDFGTTPTPSTDLMNGGPVFEEIGAIMSNDGEKDALSKNDTPKRGRPRKAPGTATSKSSRRKESNEDSEVAEDKDEHEKKTEDEDETNEETEKKTEEAPQVVLVEREDDAASSEGTNRSETATPEPAATAATTVAASKKTRATRRKKRSNVGIDEDFTAVAKKKRGSVTGVTTQLDDENEEHKMVTRARSRQP